MRRAAVAAMLAAPPLLFASLFAAPLLITSLPAAPLLAATPAGAQGAATARPAAAETPQSDLKPPAERSTRDLLQAGSIAVEEGNYARAQARFQEAADIDPRLAQAHFGLGLAALGAKDRRGAEKAFHTASDLSNGAAEVRYALGVTYFVFDDARTAEEELRAAGTERLFLEARYALGVVAAQRGDLPAAADALREAIRIDNGHAASHYQLGSVLARGGDLDGALRELARAMAAAPGLVDARPEDPIVFLERSFRPSAAAAGHAAAIGMSGLPLPVIRPSLAWSKRRPVFNGSPQPAEIPDWYLYYYMALLLDDAGRWPGAVDMLERAIAIKDRSESLAIIADRLVDYSPHLHLAEAYHQLGNYREAFLHLGIAKNEGKASPEAMRALTVLVQKDRLRPRIVLQPLPDHTTAESVAIRGVVIADEAPQHVEVAGKEAVLRAASASEVADFVGDKDRPAKDQGASKDGGQTTLFEVPEFRLGAGTNVISIRPAFRNPARDGDIVEARVVRLPPPPPPPPAPEPPKPAAPKPAKPKAGPSKPAPGAQPKPGPGALQPAKPAPPKPATAAAEGKP